MAEDPDLERQLEEMFAALRPAASYQERLWQRMQGRRPWWRSIFAGPPVMTRLAPALAAVLIVAGGLGYLIASRPPGGGTAGSGGSAAAPAFTTSQASFGKLPRPGLTAADSAAHGAATALAPSRPTAAGYRFVGTPPQLPVAASVYRYQEPDAGRRAELAAELERRSGLSVSLSPSRPGAGLPPLFTADGSIPAGGGGPGAADAAVASLRQLNLLPGYPTRRMVSGGTLVLVRQFQTGVQKVDQVDGQGNPVGVEIGLSAVHRPITGPVELPLAVAAYPLRPASEVVGSLPPPAGGADQVGLLDRAELVYLAVSTGAAEGYLEPAIRLSGPGGTVLLPAVALQYLTP